MHNLHILSHLKKVTRTRSGWTACCPAHDDQQPSLSLREDNGRLLWKCHAGCSQEDVGRKLRDMGLQGRDLVQDAHLRYSSKDAIRQINRIDAAQRIIAECQPAKGTLVEAYLNSRSIIAVPAQLLFHPDLYHSPGQNFPAMVARIFDPITRKPAGSIHRTWLSHDGLGKALITPEKKMLGPCAGGVVILGNHIEGQTVLVGEGIETVLSGMQSTGFLGLAALSAGNLERLVLPSSLNDIIILADNDESGVGLKSARVLANRMNKNGCSVRIATPPFNGDMNDLLRKGDIE